MTALVRAAARAGRRAVVGRRTGSTPAPPRARWHGEAGQTLVLIVLALPVMLGMSALVIDVGNLFVEKRSVQQAADAAALAGAQGLSGTACDSTCQGRVATLVGNYRAKNLAGSAAGPMTRCSAGVTTNCFNLPAADRVEVKLSKIVPTFFGGLLGSSSFVVSARAAASRFDYTATTPGATVVTPGSTVVAPGTTSTVYSTATTNTPGLGIFSYAASTACNAIRITGGNHTFVNGGPWSNGGITASGAADTATSVRVGTPPPGCAFPSQLNPPGPTATAKRANGGSVTTLVANPNANHINVTSAAGFAAGQVIFIDAAPNAESRTISSIAGADITLSSPLSITHAVGVIVTNIDFPLPLRNPPSTCTSGTGTIDAGWLSANPPGVYCFTGNIDVRAGFTGYTFVSRDSTANNAIKCTVNNLSFAAPSPAHSSLLFYAVRGGVSFSGVVTVDGQVLAPQGDIVFNGGTNAQNGFMQAQTITITNTGTTFLGSGPGGAGTTTTTTTPVSTTTTPATTNVTPGSTTTNPDTVSTVGTGSSLDE